MHRCGTLAGLVALSAACVQPNPGFVVGTDTTAVVDDSSGSGSGSGGSSSGEPGCAPGEICLSPERSIFVARGRVAFALGDVDRDGREDVLAMVEGSAWVMDGAGAMVQAAQGGFQMDVAHLVDLDADGDLDIVAGANGSRIGRFVSVGAGGFEEPEFWPVAAQATGVAGLDLDGDGRRDLAASTGDVLSFAFADAGGGFPSWATRPAMGAGDLVGFDGHPQMQGTLAATTATGVTVFGYDGAAWTQVDAQAGTGPVALALGDVDADGNVDIVVAGTSPPSITVLRGVAGEWAFSPMAAIALDAAPTDVAVGDLDGDDVLDLVVTRGDAALTVQRGLGGGSFDAMSVGLDGAAVGVAIGDLDGNGRADVVLVRGNDELTVMSST